MIQSDIFDSVDMNIKKITNTAFLFVSKKLSEILGILIFITGFLLFISLISYSPEDPNFIFPENMEIKNWLGFRGSYVSDLFFQSVGLISYLFSLTLIFTGINIFLNKDFFLIIENIFYSILYLLFGSLFFSYFYNTAFILFINGNGGFIGTYLNDNIFNNDDSILITRTFLNKLKKIHKLILSYEKNKNLNETIRNARPPIFWKDKPIVEKQIRTWKPDLIKKLIIDINEIELQIKKNNR